MEDQCSPLSWAYYYQEEGVEELKRSLLYSTLELEAAVISAHEEITRKDDEILQLKDLQAKIIKEKEEFQEKFQELVLEKQLLFQQVQIQVHSLKQLPDCPISSGTTSNDNDNVDLSPSDCDDSTSKATPPLTVAVQPVPDIIDEIAVKKPLPEQGKFLQAVMEAGPLLQTLLLAGPLPQWQHPPPQLNSVDIPPVTISSPAATARILQHQQDSRQVSPTSSGFAARRAMVSSDFSPKYQKVCSPIFHSSLTTPT